MAAALAAVRWTRDPSNGPIAIELHVEELRPNERGVAWRLLRVFVQTEDRDGKHARRTQPARLACTARAPTHGRVGDPVARRNR